ncbi:hypothetical protein NS228_08835 [Methylobacterium indicum]|uniref:Uncharacterized protein n=1 Tax=Methylobacterium indicum TaxID=1775910 RepID=A0A8H9C7G3_9HYPH|nr:hypothetical protein [Methylobacterium indicum]KTS19203.1 hypothetical protein NS229_26280 [Methylobacterium indicum]KTS40890.1 hypothetical protein NS228_08835 [Methylobacterium indicum]KTS44717.1 hypothetical protein NS230_24950 [Methylobacterium indicum]BCM84676.1 hypothetical protein mvi_31370 [Methylobacterium indicum]
MTTGIGTGATTGERDRQDGYAAEYAATAGQQAAFFREQAERHRRQAEQARIFADLSHGEDGAEQNRRAERLETLGRHGDTMAAAFEARARRL